MDIERATFKDLVDLNELQLLFEKFSAATGFTTGLVDHATNEVLLGTTGWRDICIKFHRACPKSLEHCKASNKELTSGLSHTGEIRIHHCKNGLVDGATPIIIAGKHFANLFTGQVLFAPPDIEQFRSQAQQYGYDEQAYLASLAEVPVVSEERFTAMLQYLAQTASMIAQTGLSNLKSRTESTGKEALLQSIFRSAPVGIGFVANRVLQWTNEKMSEITGYSSVELEGKTARMLYPSEEEFAWVGREKYRQIKEYGTGSVDTRFKRKDGSIIDVHLSSSPIDQQDWNAGVTFTALDITARKKAAAAIQQNEERLQLALEGADLGMWDWDIQTNAVYFSPRYFSMLGYGPTELPHTFATWENLLHPEDKEITKQYILSCLQKPKAGWSIEFRLRAKNGQYRWVLRRGKVVEHAEDGTPLRASGTHLDITSSMVAEEKLKESEERFRELFNNMSSGVVIYEAVQDGNDFMIKDMNKAGLLSCHLEFHQAIGKSVQAVFPGVKKMGLFNVFQRVWKTGTAEHFPCSAYQDDRIRLWVENYVCKIPSGEIVAIYDDISDRKTIEDKIIKAKEEWTLTFDVMADIVTIQDTNMRIVRANKAAHALFQAKPGELNGKCCHELFTERSEPCPGCPLTDTLKDMKQHSAIVKHEKMGKIFHVSSAAIPSGEGNIQYIVHAAKDITEQKKMEEELFQAHKMEAIGTLAGGIAHDFNNILSAIIGFSELAQLNLPKGSRAGSDIDQVIRSSKRAAGLVQQILAFSRKASHQLQPLKPHLMVKEVLKMLRATLPTTLSIEEHIDTECGSILADPTNVHQIVMNLCTNAYHAMENEKGILTVILCRKEIREEDISESDVAPGPFVVLTIQDTGHGMDKKTMERIFEPYFTTKEVGKASGLGLAVIHGIVKDYKGFIQVESEPGKGSAFHIYMPALQEVTSTQEKTSTEALVPTGNERIFLVDDESSIVKLHKTVLERLGYTVTATTNSEEAFEKICTHPDAFDLVITDQTMPNLAGVELAKKILKIKPDMPIILYSGYSSAITEEGVLAIGIKKYVMKPVDRKTLAGIVRQVLDEN